MEHFILRRRGVFTSVAPKGTVDWCRSPSHTEFSYEITVICKDIGQDVVIYHEDIADAIGIPTGTCEKMASQVCQRVKNLFRQRGIAYNLIHLKVLPVIDVGVPAANMEYVSYESMHDAMLISLV